MNGTIIYSTYETQDSQTTIRLFGKLENGQSFLTLNKFKPYFFIREKDKRKALKDIKPHKPKPCSLKNFKGEPVLKVEFKTRVDLHNAYKKIYKKIPTYEADQKPQYKFLQDKNIFTTIKIEGDHAPSEKIDRVYHEPTIEPVTFNPKLKVISLDIESGSNGNLFCIGLAAENYKKNFMITNKKLENTVSCKDEEDCLEKFKQEIIKQDPDIITGWNLIDFDFSFLRDLFKKHRIKFDIGRTDNEPKLRIETSFFRTSSIDIPGRQVLDALSLIRDPIVKSSPYIRAAKFKSYTLEDVSQELLKDGKILKGKGRHKEIERLYKEDQQKLVDYNIRDCTLVLDILEKTKILSLVLERAQLTGLPLDRISGSIAAFDSLYIREAHKKGIVSPSVYYKPKEERITGGYVSSIKPGIYKNVLVLDFKSLYPSIIRTFNIDPASFIEKKEKGAIESPNKAYFKNQEGILPIIIERLHKAREKAKEESRPLSSHAIKITMNSLFGVLASPNSRYFSLEIANAITHFGQFLIKLTAKKIEEKNKKLKVLYSDTDSVFVETNLGKAKANLLGLKIEKDINNFYDKYVKKNYNRDSLLELEFEKQYLSLMIPQTRGKNAKAAKKRYAGLVEKNGKEVLEITGLEAIRGDWTKAAQEFQVQLLMKLFHDEPIEKFIRDYIQKIEQGKMDEKLIYRKSIRKNLEEYVKTTPPHVKAARKLKKLTSSVIEYYVTTDGPEPIQQLKHKIDYAHYLKKQIQPIANQILSLFGKDFDEIIQKTKQAKLF